MEDYCTQLLKPLQNLMDQHDHDYPTIQDAVTHAGKLWQTLDKDKIHQEIREEKEKFTSDMKIQNNANVILTTAHATGWTNSKVPSKAHDENKPQNMTKNQKTQN